MGRSFHASATSTSSTNASAAGASSSLLKSKVPTKSAWRQLIKPFLLKCHPDMMASVQQQQQQQDDKDNSKNSMKQINLKAIQNLNVYLDTIQAMVDSVAQARALADPTQQSEKKQDQQQPARNNQEQSVIPLEFVLLVEEMNAHGWTKKNPNMIPSRRKVELMLPNWQKSVLNRINNPQASVKERLSHLTRHVVGQLTTLLLVAGLPVPSKIRTTLLSLHEEDELEQHDDEFMGDHTAAGTENQTRGDGRSRARLNANRRRFLDSIDWNKVQKHQEKALMEEEIQKGWMKQQNKNKTQYRQHVVSSILARVQIQRYGPKGIEFSSDLSKQKKRKSKISLLDELIAFRRLSLLMVDNFEALELHEYQNTLWWERLQIVLTPERPYNTSASALHQRRVKLNKDNGFVFTLHSGNLPDQSQGLGGGKEPSEQDHPPLQGLSMTLTVPIDFRDEELLAELKRYLEDFQHMMLDGSQDIYKDGVIAEDEFYDLFHYTER
ncbi:hypothetical protein ACA910_009166 [Epithemia clementina (nom. ined.)]